MRSPEPTVAPSAPIMPLLRKELWEVIGGRALWLMALILFPLVGYSFAQAVALYAEASAPAAQSGTLASGLSPLDGILVPTLGAFYVAVTLLFPFVAIRALGGEKESGALRLLIQLPYRASTLIAAKLVAVLVAWLIAGLPALSAICAWRLLGGHVDPPETLNLLFGHLLYGTLVGTIALFAAAIADNAATAAITTLAFTIASWILDFTTAGHPGVLGWLSQLSLTQMLRSFEQGLLQARVVLGIGAVAVGFAALATVWLPPGVPLRRKLASSAACILGTAMLIGGATQVEWSVDLAEDRRNSFAAADEHALKALPAPLVIAIRLVPEDPRYTDLQRNIVAKLERTVPNVTVRLTSGRQSVRGTESDESYGEVEYTYAGRTAMSRSTSPSEVLPLLYELAGQPVPAPDPTDDYPGHPLVASADGALGWFYGVGPMLVLGAWWWTRRPPRLAHPKAEGVAS